LQQLGQGIELDGSRETVIAQSRRDGEDMGSDELDL
jgi:hypothetical protein